MFMSVTGPSYSSPWMPPDTKAVGPSPFLNTAIGTGMWP